MADKQDNNVYQMRRDIEHTRTEMHETIDVIRRKLEPDRLKHQAQDAVREATIGRAEDTMSKAMGKAEDAVSNARDTAMDASSGIMDTIRKNPVPAALAGLGLGWLLMNRSSDESMSSGHFSREQSRYGRQGSYYGEGRYRSTMDSGYPHGSRTSSLGSARETEDAGMMGQVADKAGDVRDAAAHMMDEVRSKAGDMMGDTGETVVDRGSSLLDTIRENPIPAAVASLGLGWLFMNGGSRPEHSRGPDYYSGTSGFYGRSYKGLPEEEHGTMDDVRGKIGDTVGQAQETVGDLASKAQETVGDVTGRVQEQMGSMADQTRYQYNRVEDRFQNTLNSNPLAVGAAAIAVGAVAAMMMPTTHQERQFMGEARDNLMDQVQSTAQETMQKVQKVAEQVQETAKTEAHDQGLTQ